MRRSHHAERDDYYRKRAFGTRHDGVIGTHILERLGAIMDYKAKMLILGKAKGE